jgi:fermentation-respiration switch protein FrsA (DUF1100 family)
VFVSRALLLSLLLFLSCGCSSLLYFPTARKYVDASKLAVQPRDVWIGEGDARIHAWYFWSPPPLKSKGMIAFFHGNAQNITSHFQALYWLLDYGYDFVIFDYRGYGESPGHPSPQSTVEDGRAALRWAHQQEPKLPLIVFGQSLGGAVALRVAGELRDELPLSFVVVDSTFASYRAAGRDVLSRSWLTWLFQPLASLLLSDEYAPLDFIPRISPTPLLVIHGDADRVISQSLGKEVYALAREPKEFWSIAGARHTEALWLREPDTRQRLRHRLDEIVEIARAHAPDAGH